MFSLAAQGVSATSYENRPEEELPLGSLQDGPWLALADRMEAPLLGHPGQ
jgi:hypothetical protein